MGECGEIKQRWMIGEISGMDNFLQEAIESTKSQKTKSIEECEQLVNKGQIDNMKRPHQSS